MLCSSRTSFHLSFLAFGKDQDGTCTGVILPRDGGGRDYTGKCKVCMLVKVSRALHTVTLAGTGGVS